MSETPKEIEGSGAHLGDTHEISHDTVVRSRADRPRHGWRAFVYALTGGRFNPGVSASEAEYNAVVRRIRRQLPGAHRIAVTSIKGGVGKTTVTACLGLTLAEHRGDRAVALDANPDAGTLADRLTGEAGVTVRQFLNNIESISSLTDMARFTSLAGRLQVLASDQDPAMSEAFNREEYESVVGVLSRFCNVLLTDSGTGLVHSAMEGTLVAADTLVVVGAPTVDGASRASKTLDWLTAHGHADLVSRAVVVLSCDRTSVDVDTAQIREHFARRCRGVHEIPHDPHLATGGRIDLDALRGSTRDAFLHLAADIADGFGVHAVAVAQK
ncbi:MinD/ParA family ATP-binding protein [Pseudonocardia alni]|uniref:MinD/ParA family ATP-binding protein n=1 Tax=Pseudonocardia alni TaxID=33907 RepID=UPI00280B5D2F|nr:MinD/ParA family protein [Pseudonocardia alni]